jgi:hypothetical protein
MSQGESRLSRQIMDRLRAMGIFCFKVHGGPTMMAGLPDIIACVPARIYTFDDFEAGAAPSTVGLFVGFETKMPAGGDPTPIQQRVHGEIRQAHGRTFIVRSVQDAVDALDSMGGNDELA